MKINLNVKKPERSIAVGDVVICECGKYLLIEASNTSSYPYVFVNLSNFRKVNGYDDLRDIRDSVYSGSGKILEVIKSEDLEIRRIV